MLSQSRLRHVLKYFPETGDFIWLNPTSNRVKKGSIAGSVDRMSGGTYLRIRIDGILYNAHRLAFLYMEGEFPGDMTDHKDGNGLNNQWKNLRKATSSQNNKNSKKRSHNTSGHCGVAWNKKKSKWQAMLTTNGKVVYLGFFDDKKDAAQARINANQEFGFTARHGM